MASQAKPLIEAVALRDLIAMHFDAEEQLLGKLFLARSIGMVFGPRGSGKSLLAMLIAYAIAAGKYVAPWGYGKGAVVCYLDGEMRIRGFKERIDQLAGRNSKPDSVAMAKDNFHVISRDYVKHPIGSIDTDEGQKAVDALLPEDVSFLVIDNLSAWTESGGEGASWQTIKRWLLQKRLNGVAVLMLHHAGKSGTQRGTSAHEDLLDYSIRVMPILQDDASKTVFDVDHTKLRDHLPELRGAFRFSVYSEDGVMHFDSSPVASAQDEKLEEIRALAAQGHSVTQIAKQVGRHKSTVSRAMKKIAQEDAEQPDAEAAPDSQEDE